MPAADGALRVEYVNGGRLFGLVMQGGSLADAKISEISLEDAPGGRFARPHLLYDSLEVCIGDAKLVGDGHELQLSDSVGGANLFPHATREQDDEPDRHGKSIENEVPQQNLWVTSGSGK